MKIRAVGCRAFLTIETNDEKGDNRLRYLLNKEIMSLRTEMAIRL